LFLEIQKAYWNFRDTALKAQIKSGSNLVWLAIQIFQSPFLSHTQGEKLVWWRQPVQKQHHDKELATVKNNSQW